MITLVSSRRLRKGEELALNYGAKGNGELLLYYGFVLVENPADVCTLRLPLPLPLPLLLPAQPQACAHAQERHPKAVIERALTERALRVGSSTVDLIAAAMAVVLPSPGTEVAVSEIARVDHQQRLQHLVHHHRLGSPSFTLFRPLPQYDEVGSVGEGGLGEMEGLGGKLMLLGQRLLDMARILTLAPTESAQWCAAVLKSTTTTTTNSTSTSSSSDIVDVYGEDADTHIRHVAMTTTTECKALGALCCVLQAEVRARESGKDAIAAATEDSVKKSMAQAFRDSELAVLGAALEASSDLLRHVLSQVKKEEVSTTQHQQ
jgi:hypothetical protein